MAVRLLRNGQKLDAYSEDNQLIGSLPIDAVDIRQDSKIKAAFEAASEAIDASFERKGLTSGALMTGWRIRTEGQPDVFVAQGRGEEDFERTLVAMRTQYARRLL